MMKLRNLELVVRMGGRQTYARYYSSASIAAVHRRPFSAGRQQPLNDEANSFNNLKSDLEKLLPQRRRRRNMPGSSSSSAVKPGPNGPMVWIDCEMSGLDLSKDHIIEICCLLTDGNLNLIEPNGYEAVIHYPKEFMDQMDSWCTETHAKSGLTEKVISSTKTNQQVSQELLEYLKKYIPAPRTGVLSGNSVHVDRQFLQIDMPEVANHLHYRIIDASTLTEIARRKNPSLLDRSPRKKGAHTARSDIIESIAELKWYYDNWLFPKSNESSNRKDV